MTINLLHTQSLELEKGKMIDYNLVMWIGLGLIVGGFCLFLYSEMRLRQLDREQWKLNQSFNKAKNDEQNRNDKRVKRNLKSVSL